jgi:hypothetical protein
MDKLPPEPRPNPDDPAAAKTDMVAAQIKRQLQGEGTAPPAADGPQRPAASDPGFAFHMRMRSGGNELTDSAEEFRSEHAAEEPPAFSETWDSVAQTVEDGGGGGWLKLLLIVAAVAVVGVAVWLWGIPAWQAHQESAAQAGAAKADSQKPILEAVAVDDELDQNVRAALLAGNAGWKQAGLDAYVYRYRLAEEKVENVSQTLTINAHVGGKDADKAVSASRTAFDTATAGFISGLTAHPGVTCQIKLLEVEADEAPEEGEKYLVYGYDYGQEHLHQLQPVIDALEQLRRDKGSYPRVLSETLVTPKLRTSGGVKFMSRGMGYLPLFKTDAGGNIAMGTGDGTLERMTPQAVTGYYLFVYLGDAGEGLDVLSQSDVDYYSRKIAPLPYDTGGTRLHNVSLKGDDIPDGVGCVVKTGKILHEGEK